jgi:vanillate O-demethylase ferredoxin subunit
MLKVNVVAVNHTAEGIRAFELAHEGDHALPPFTAGSHIDVHIADGLIRQYSLCNSPSETHRYVIGVLREPSSRGGSEAMHRLKTGMSLRISEPRNHFPLVDDASHSILVAGGIGITPLLAMAEHLTETGRPFELHYCVRSRSKLAFADRLDMSLMRDKVTVHIDEELPSRLDAQTFFQSSDKSAHVYVCGPTGFIDYVLKSARDAGFPEQKLHREYFGHAIVNDGEEQAFEIEIASTGERVLVEAGESAVEALARRGIEIPVSCEQGVCGTCLTRVREGVPLHRDVYLSDCEHKANNQFTPCCSRAVTPVLVLDL